MTNAMIILTESIKLMEEGKIKSTGNKIIVETSEGKKTLEEPEAIHTYQAWKSLGYQVKKGSKAVAQFPVWKHTTKKVENKDGEEEEKSNMFMKMSSFFTIGQVERIENA